jgi:hypothetical protein
MSSGLITLHAIAAAAHLVQFVVVLALVIKQPGDDWPLVSQAYEKQAKNYQYKLAYLLPLFPLLSAVNHTISCAAPSWYRTVLAKEVNIARWAEFSLSSGVMLWIIGTLSGTVEIRTLVSIVVLNAALQYIGYMIEQSKSNPRLSRQLLGIGFSIHAAIWLQIIVSFYTSISNSDNTIPSAVYAIIPVMFTLFTSFGILAALWISDRITSFERLEMGYIILSFVSKTLLTWMVYFGVVRDREDVPFVEGQSTVVVT